MVMKRALASRALFALLVILSLSSCSDGRPQSGLATATLRAGGNELVVELARSPEEMQTGLMYRKALPDGRGMLFVYESDRRMSFWMKNTYVPLSIAFLGSDGTVREILDMQPLSEAIVESSRYARYALEVPQGWFERAGIAVGDRFDLSELRRGE